MTIEIVSGDVLDALDRDEIDVVGHIVNCQAVMGSGIARSIRDRYPKVYEAYLESFKEAAEEGIDNLGMLGHVEVVGGVANLYAQFNYGRDKRHLNYGALGKCLQSLSKFAGGHLTYGFPYKMGSDRAGGDFSIVLEMIEFYFKDHNVRIYKL